MTDYALYRDFKLTEENCDAEPIHRPLAIAGHGYLMAVREDSPDHLHAASENLEELLGVTRKELFSTSLEKLLPQEIFSVYKEMENPDNWDSVDPIPLSINDQQYNMIRHLNDQVRFIEIEPKKSSFQEKYSTFHAIRLVTEKMSKINDIDSLAQHAAQQMRKVFQYDRVMVYKFERDGHGFVMAEDVDQSYESFLGLHYPATDIPKMARELFKINRSRILPDINSSNHWLNFNPNHLVKEYLDLTYTQLRAVSPIHIEYLQNMKVEATFTIAIVVENKLWGLFAFHHYAPHFVNYEMRKSGELIAGAFSHRINELLKDAEIKKENQLRKLEELIFSQLDAVTDITNQLIKKSIDFREICEADGFALISNSGNYKFGNIPNTPLLTKITNHLFQEEIQLFQTDNITEKFALEEENDLGGLLAIFIPDMSNLLLLWFRNSKVKSNQWAGDPNKPYELDYREDGELRLSPRVSFEKWKNIIRTEGDPWTAMNVRTAMKIREGLLKKNVESEAVKAKLLRTEMEQLSYITSHDLQEPLRTVTNYMSLLEKELKGKDTERSLSYLQRTTKATNRMKRLISDLLGYSKSGKNEAKDRQWEDLENIIEEIKEDHSLLIQENDAKIQYQDLPSIFCVRTEAKQLFANLLTNSIKYRKEHESPRITISHEIQADSYIFSLEDNGIGIEEAYYDKIFLLFQRLHGKEEYEGTGIGLAQCKKVVESLGGEIWVTSVVGKGSTFHVSLHKSNVKQ